MKPVMANTLKNQVSTHTLLIYTKMLNWSYPLSILRAALDFIDCTSKTKYFITRALPYKSHISCFYQAKN